MVIEATCTVICSSLAASQSVYLVVMDKLKIDVAGEFIFVQYLYELHYYYVQWRIYEKNKKSIQQIENEFERNYDMLCERSISNYFTKKNGRIINYGSLCKGYDEYWRIN